MRLGADCVMHVGVPPTTLTENSRGISDYSSIALILLQNKGLGNVLPTPMNSLLPT